VTLVTCFLFSMVSVAEHRRWKDSGHGADPGCLLNSWMWELAVDPMASPMVCLLYFLFGQRSCFPP